MLDVTQILQKVDEQKTFEIHIQEENEEDNWILRIKKPGLRKSQKWLNFMMSHFMSIMTNDTASRSSDFDENDKPNSDKIGQRFLTDNLDRLLDFADEILDLADSWEGIKAENKKQIKDFMMLTPLQTALFAVNFISNFQQWQQGLKKSLPQESNGNLD